MGTQRTTTARSPWFEDDAFWRRFGLAAFGDERWERAEAECPDLIALLGVAADGRGRLLDLCCGPGRHTLALAARGFRVTAVDRSADYLDQLRARATSFVAVETVRCDMRDFLRRGAFDGALCVGLSFGYLEDDVDDRTVLSNLRRSLRSGARLVLDVPTPAWPIALEPWFLVEKPEVRALVQVERGRGDESVTLRWSFSARGDDAPEALFVQRLYSPARITDLLHEAGFRDIEVHGGFDRRPIDESSRKAVVVATASEP